jgi:hypothetical protein
LRKLIIETAIQLERKHIDVIQLANSVRPPEVVELDGRCAEQAPEDEADNP